MGQVTITNEQVHEAFSRAVQGIECPRVIATGEPFENSVDEGFFEFLDEGGHLTKEYIDNYYAAMEAC